MNETLLIGSVLLVFLLVSILFEAIIITVFNLNWFGKAVAAATLVNLASVAVIYCIWPFISSLNIKEDKVLPLLPILFFTTIVVEGFLLWLLNKQQSLKTILMIAAVMNIVSFGILYLIFAVSII